MFSCSGAVKITSMAAIIVLLLCAVMVGEVCSELHVWIQCVLDSIIPLVPFTHTSPMAVYGMRFGMIVLRSSTSIAVEVFVLPVKLIAYTGARILAIVQVRTPHSTHALVGWLLRPLGQRMFTQCSRMRTIVCKCRIVRLDQGDGVGCSGAFVRARNASLRAYACARI